MVNLMNLFMFLDKLIMFIVMKNKVIPFLYLLLSFWTLCMLSAVLTVPITKLTIKILFLGWKVGYEI
jgi:hypothetical protein